MYHNSPGRLNRYQRFWNKLFNKKKSIQQKIDNLSLEIHSLEESNPDLTKGSALSRRQLKRISHDKWVDDVVDKYDHMVKGSH